MRSRRFGISRHEHHTTPQNKVARAGGEPDTAMTLFPRASVPVTAQCPPRSTVSPCSAVREQPASGLAHAGDAHEVLAGAMRKRRGEFRVRVPEPGIRDARLDDRQPAEKISEVRDRVVVGPVPACGVGAEDIVRLGALGVADGEHEVAAGARAAT